jgi:1-phosphatidylinositol-3-phosphate 5-kinase
LLKGANGDELKKVKHVVQYGVFAAYHLALETSFLVDEGATLPELPLKSPIIVALPDKPSSADRSISTIPIIPIPSASTPNSCLQAFGLQNDDLAFNDTKQMEQTALGGPYDETTSVPINSQNGRITCLLDMVPQSPVGPLVHQSNIHCPDGTGDVNTKMNLQGSLHGTSRNALVNDFSVSPAHPTSLMSAKGDSGDKVADKPAAPLNVQISHDDASIKDNSVAKTDEIPASPADNQSILVSLSSRCVWKETLCERPHLLRIKYYGNFDKPLGRFLRDQLFDQVRLRSSTSIFAFKPYIVLNLNFYFRATSANLVSCHQRPMFIAMFTPKAV